MAQWHPRELSKRGGGITSLARRRECYRRDLTSSIEALFGFCRRHDIRRLFSRTPVISSRFGTEMRKKLSLASRDPLSSGRSCQRHRIATACGESGESVLWAMESSRILWTTCGEAVERRAMSSIPPHTHLFTDVDRTSDPDFFVRFMDEAQKPAAIQTSKQIMLERMHVAPGEAILEARPIQLPGAAPGVSRQCLVPPEFRSTPNLAGHESFACDGK
jgi:hypothetical protein